MNILALESSCDETSVAVVKDGRRIISNIVASQIAIHAKYSGVVPELASRAHIENINPVISAALKKAHIDFHSLRDKIDAIAYTRGPGLAGSLLVGQVAAQTLSFIFDIPIIDINHLEGHLYAVLLEHRFLMPPYLALIVSGGHTEMIIVDDFGSYRFLGGTRDDAAGEAFDKVAKLLHLEYPGGPVIDRLSQEGNPAAIIFPRPYLPGTWDFSFSGLKTAVVNHIKKRGSPGAREVRDICASFQAAVVDTLIVKTMAAAKEYGVRTIVIGGGVAANTSLRRAFQKKAQQEHMKVYAPSLALCTDNAAMIAVAGYFKVRKIKGVTADHGVPQKIEPGLRLANW